MYLRFLTVFAGAASIFSGGEALGQTAESPLYLECSLIPVPADAGHVGNARQFMVTDLALFEWKPERGVFEFNTFEGSPDPVFELTPTLIRLTYPSSMGLGAVDSQITIDRTTGSYRLVYTRHGNPWLDATGRCSQITRPAPARTVF